MTFKPPINHFHELKGKNRYVQVYMVECRLYAGNKFHSRNVFIRLRLNKTEKLLYMSKIQFIAMAEQGLTRSLKFKLNLMESNN